MITQLDTENADRDLTALVTVLTDTPDASSAMICQGLVMLGDGVKDLDGTGGTFELVITVDGQTVQPSPQEVEFGTEIRSSVWTTVFPVPANKEVIMRVKSPNGADTDVDVTAFLYDISAHPSLVQNNLDHLAAVATAGADMTTEVVDNSILSRVLANGDTSEFVPSTDGLQPIRDVAPHGSAMRGTDGANTTVPDAAGTAAGLHTTTDGKVDANKTVIDTIAGDVANIDGDAMRGTDSANTTVPDAAGTAAGLHTTTDGKVDANKTVIDTIAGDVANIDGDAIPSAADVVTALFAKTGITAGGSASFNDLVKAFYALARGKIVKTGDAYAFYDDDGSTVLFTLTIAAGERSTA